MILSILNYAKLAAIDARLAVVTVIIV